MTPASPPNESRTWPKAIPLLVLAGMLAYANSFTKAFVFDDAVWITRNVDIGDPFRYLASVGRPLVSLTVLGNYQLGGFNPTGYHAFNLAIHILSGLTLFGLVRRVLLQPRFEGRYDDSAPYIAFASALLWLVHPLETQAVTYIIQRAESMMGLFFLFTFYCWLRASTDGGRWWYPAAVASFSFSCFCKEVALTLPPLLLIFDRIFVARSWQVILRDRWMPYLGILIVWGITIKPLITVALVTGAEAGAGFGITSATPYQYLLTQSEVILHYLRLSFWPVGQAIDYFDWPIAHSMSEVWPAFFAVSGALLASFVLLFVRPPLGFLGLWFFGILAPTSSIMPIIDPVFEHRMYLSLAAVVVGTVLALDSMLRLFKNSVRLPVACVLVGAAAATLIVLTYLRNESYRTYRASVEDNIARRPNNPRPLFTLVAIKIGSNELDEAGELIRRGLQIDSPVASALYRQFAPWLVLKGRADDAEILYHTLVKESDYHFYFSPPEYQNYALLLISRGKPSEAAAVMRSLIEHQPHVADHYLLLAAAELASGRKNEASAAIHEALRLNPDCAKIPENTARGLIFARESPATPLYKPRALWLAETACMADGDRDPRMLDTLAMAYAWNGQFAKAADAAKRGIAAAEVRGDEDWVIALKARLKLYEAGKPYNSGGETASKAPKK